jgi:hypothetical protein
MTENQLNMLEPLTVMNLMQNYTKLRVSRIFLIYDHFIIIHIILVPVEMCQIVFMLDTNIAPYQNRSGYIYCASTSVTILQLCPSSTEMTFQVGGCVNKTSKTEKIIFRFEVLCVVLANTTVFPAGSRCASQPCQNGGLCYDFLSADAYYCRCFPPYTSLHYHLWFRCVSLIHLIKLFVTVVFVTCPMDHTWTV